MNAPWVRVVLRSALLHPFNHFGRQPGSLTVFLFDISGQFSVHQFEPRQNVSVLIHAAVGKVMPGIIALVAPGPHVLVVGGIQSVFWVVMPIWAGDRHAVVPHVRVKTALTHAHTNNAIGGDSEPLDAFPVCPHMGFANQNTVHVHIA